MSSASPSSGEPTGVGSSSDLRRSVTQATDRIHEIIDAAERVAVEIRSDAENSAEAYLAERRREADELAASRIREAERAAGERTRALDELIETLADSAERFKHQAEEMLGDLDRVITEARAGVNAAGTALSVGEPAPITPLREVEPEPEPPAAEPPKVVVAAYPGRGASVGEPEPEPEPSADQTSEAVLRATQMAVIGKSRKEIAKALKSDFPGVDAESVLNEILE